MSETTPNENHSNQNNNNNNNNESINSDNSVKKEASDSNRSNNNNNNNNKRKYDSSDNNHRSSHGGNNSSSKRSNNNNNSSSSSSRDRGGGDQQPEDQECYFKLMIPSAVAGGVIGRGGDKIGQIQKDAQVRMKMSKANEYYPNTQERVCLIIGSVKSVIKAHSYIVERMQEKHDGNRDSELLERVNQIKILIPNSTAGLLIGKGGAYIKQIKDESGAFVQISSKQTDLPERIVTIEGEVEKRNKALQIIVRKIADDPQHNTVTTLNYPQHSSGGGSSQSGSSGGGGGGSSQGGGGYGADLSQYGGMVAALQGANQKFDFNTAAYYLSGLNNLALLIINCGGSYQMTADNLKLSLRNAGYSSSASGEILDAITVLMSYGLITKVSPATLLATNPSLASLANLGPVGLANITTALAASMQGVGAGAPGGGGPSNQIASSGGYSTSQQQQQQGYSHQQQQHGYYHQNGNNSGGGGHMGKVNRK